MLGEVQFFSSWANIHALRINRAIDDSVLMLCTVTNFRNPDVFAPCG